MTFRIKDTIVLKGTFTFTPDMFDPTSAAYQYVCVVIQDLVSKLLYNINPKMDTHKIVTLDGFGVHHGEHF